jgi:hypothetical protein
MIRRYKSIVTTTDQAAVVITSEFTGSRVLMMCQAFF